jgi:hypothetical protein
MFAPSGGTHGQGEGVFHCPSRFEKLFDGISYVAIFVVVILSPVSAPRMVAQ